MKAISKSTKLHVFWIYYKKIALPSILFVGVLWFLGSDPASYSWSMFGRVYLFVAPMVQYIQYHIRLHNENYFYYNFGFSKRTLWTYSLGVNLAIWFICLLITIL